MYVWILPNMFTLYLHLHQPFIPHFVSFSLKKMQPTELLSSHPLGWTAPTPMVTQSGGSYFHTWTSETFQSSSDNYPQLCLQGLFTVAFRSRTEGLICTLTAGKGERGHHGGEQRIQDPGAESAPRKGFCCSRQRTSDQTLCWLLVCWCGNHLCWAGPKYHFKRKMQYLFQKKTVKLQPPLASK